MTDEEIKKHKVAYQLAEKLVELQLEYDRYSKQTETDDELLDDLQRDKNIREEAVKENQLVLKYLTQAKVIVPLAKNREAAIAQNTHLGRLIHALKFEKMVIELPQVANAMFNNETKGVWSEVIGAFSKRDRKSFLIALGNLLDSIVVDLTHVDLPPVSPQAKFIEED